MDANDIALRVFGILVIIASFAVPSSARRVFIHAIWIYALLGFVSVACIVAVIRGFAGGSWHGSWFGLISLVSGAALSGALPAYVLYDFVTRHRTDYHSVTPRSRRTI